MLSAARDLLKFPRTQVEAVFGDGLAAVALGLVGRARDRQPSAEAIRSRARIRIEPDDRHGRPRARC